MENLFASIFKYQTFYFRNGELGFHWVASPWLVLLALTAAITGLYFIYRPQIRRLPEPYGWVFFGLRAALVAFAFVLLLRPTLTLPMMAPREGVVAILVDNSKSMGLEYDGRIRGEVVKDLLSSESEFLEKLNDNFYLKQYQFGGSARSLDDIALLDWSEDQTDIGRALERVLSDSKNLPLSGVILLSDGSNTSQRSGTQVLARLQKLGIPVHAVGIGPRRLDKDVEMVQVRTPKELLPDTAAVARVTLRHSGYGGVKGRLEIRESGTLLGSVEVRLPRDSDTAYAELRLYPKSEGVKTYDFRFLPLEGERIAENNSKSAVVQVSDSRPRVLYLEGQPRWEFKFLRRALSDDRYIRFESLLRTALNKFYRQGIEEETVLAAGFPTTKEELYQYQGILIGNVESAFFSYAQMELLRDFVGHRGGGLMMMGGNSTLSNGGYQNTPVEEMLPVRLEQAGTNDSPPSYQRGQARAVLTPFGAGHPALELERNGGENLALWEGFPDLIDRNRVRGLKRGATVLAQFRSETHEYWNEEPLLVSQRYGSGLAAAFLTGSSWRWQMLRDHEDKSHETFWKQIMRWLVLSADAPVTVETERDVYSVGDRVSIRADVRDSTFARINSAKVEAVITSSDGVESKVSLRWNAREDGVYGADWSPRIDGLHQIRIEALADGELEASPGRATSYFMTRTGTREYFDSTLKEDYLRQISEQTGGRYYSFAEAESLPTEIRYVESQASVIEVLDLWDMPFNLILLLALLFSEWLIRRRLGTL